MDKIIKYYILFLIPFVLLSCTNNKLKDTAWSTKYELDEVIARNLYYDVSRYYNIGDYNEYITRLSNDSTNASKLYNSLLSNDYDIRYKYKNLYYSKYNIEFLTNEKCAVKENKNTIFCIYKFENSNLVLYFDMPNGNRIIYDMGTIENNNCIRFRKIAEGNYFTKIK